MVWFVLPPLLGAQSLPKNFVDIRSIKFGLYLSQICVMEVNFICCFLSHKIALPQLVDLEAKCRQQGRLDS